MAECHLLLFITIVGVFFMSLGHEFRPSQVKTKQSARAPLVTLRSSFRSCTDAATVVAKMKNN